MIKLSYLINNTDLTTFKPAATQRFSQGWTRIYKTKSIYSYALFALPRRVHSADE